MDDDTPILPAHIEDTVRAIAQLHADHYKGASQLQRVVDRSTAAVGQPRFVGVLTAVVLGWIAFNMAAVWWGWVAIDPPPFPWLQGAVSLVALYVTVLILTTQRREDQLAQYREQLTLELAILGEQKSAKIIQLLMEMRRDATCMRNRVDHEAEAMSVPADPQSVLDAIKDSYEELAAPEPTVVLATGVTT